jgi:hypothetical protein
MYSLRRHMEAADPTISAAPALLFQELDDCLRHRRSGDNAAMAEPVGLHQPDMRPEPGDRLGIGKRHFLVVLGVDHQGADLQVMHHPVDPELGQWPSGEPKT